MNIGPTRGSFPKAEHAESADHRRHRYEAWIITTHQAALAIDAARDESDTRHLDPEHDAVMAQPNRSSASRPSQALSVRARCWQCVAGDADDGGTKRIKNCASQRCALWSVRPYQDDAAKIVRRSRRDIRLLDSGIHPQDHGAKALAHPGNRPMAVRGYCHQCMGGRPDTTTMREVAACRVANCALWPARPGAQKKTPGSGL